jgi:hypothetical protein
MRAALRTFRSARRLTADRFNICPQMRMRFEGCVTSIAAMTLPTLEAHHSRTRHSA